MKYRAVAAEFNLNLGLRHWKVQFVCFFNSLFSYSSLFFPLLLLPSTSPVLSYSLPPPQYCLWRNYFWGRVDSLSNELDGSSPSVPMYKDTSSYRINILLIPIQRTFYFKLMNLWINKFSTIVRIHIQKTIYFIDQIHILQCQNVLPCSANREKDPSIINFNKWDKTISFLRQLNKIISQTYSTIRLVEKQDSLSLLCGLLVDFYLK